MEYLKIEEVSKSYGEKLLLDKINLTINKGDKIALIAKNGSGKSTLLRIIAGLESAEGEQANVLLSKQVRVGFLDQEPDIKSGATVEEIFLNIDMPAIKALKSYKAALNHPENKGLEEAVSEMEDLKAWDIEAKGHEILFRLNLTDLGQIADVLSGGQQKRLALARIILSEPDFLILDEPTNHLDIEMIEWLETYLGNSGMTLFMVTHDRYFLERVCNEIIELDKGNLFIYRGNYSDYLEKKGLRNQQEEVVHHKAKRLLSKELEWMRRQPKARGTKAKSRIDEYEKLDEKVSSITFDEAFTIELDSTRLGKKILEFYDVSKGYDGRTLIKEFWYKFKKGERVGISGPNGSGKTTLVKLITGLIRPDLGKRVEGDTVQFGYYTQDGLQMDEDKRVIDVIRDIADYIPLKKGLKLSAAALLERFMFTREHQQVYVSQLSGGEKKRLHLLTILIKNPNFLILDEPTNDLDILTLNVLESYLLQFPGCLVIISHDRFFMDKLVDHMFIFTGEDGRIQDFNGTYSEWKVSSKATRNKKKSKDIKGVVEVPEVIESEESRKLSYNEKQELKRLERDIKKLESRKSKIESMFSSGLTDSDEITTLSKELGEIKSTIDNHETRWLELSEFDQ
ncbi:MAG: ATP-binding cassette subfamily F protein uup [Saprospiraceae bacterium]|jgi:ATP-binding cassette subfamily F protein uup